MRSRSLALLALLLASAALGLRFAAGVGAVPDRPALASGNVTAPSGPTADLQPARARAREARPENLRAPGSGRRSRESAVTDWVEIVDHVEDVNGVPVKGAVLYDAETDLALATTDARGEARRRYPAHEPPEVRYHVVRADGYADQRSPARASPADCATRWVLRPVGALDGRVLRRGGGEFGVRVAAYPETEDLRRRIEAGKRGGAPRGSVWVDPDGSYRIGNLAPGPWRVAATHRGREWTWSGVVVVARARTARVEDLTVVESPPDPTLEGRVVDAGGRPVPGARVEYSHSAGGAGTRSTDEDGRFSVSGPPGVQVLLEVDGGARLGTTRAVASFECAPLELVLLGRAALVVRLERPAGSATRDVQWRFLDASGRVLVTHRADADVERVDWPASAVWIDVAADALFAGERVALPARPDRGEDSVLLRLRRAGH